MPPGEAAHVPALGWVLPFVLILAAIAVCPLWMPHWWEKNRNKLLVSTVLGIPVAAYLLWQGQFHALFDSSIEYLQFLTLLGTLYYVTGGIVIRGDIRATPAVNTGFLALGSALASLIGTTGASMLLIRPLLHTNAERKHVSHTVVFFIFLVSNIGGALTPLGDPPLFLGFLRGVPFAWTLGLWRPWLLVNGLLLSIYYFLDVRRHSTEEYKDLLRDEAEQVPLRLAGRLNFLFLGAIVAAVALMPSPYREALMLGAAALSHLATAKSIREENEFTVGPILEVAALFAGIFVTMVPALQILRVQGPRLGLDTPAEFFWATGALSSFLDNAPTYVTFFETARSLAAPGHTLVAGVPAHFLEAVSLGAVFMGANTYIGNGPNFMVKAVAESAKVRMPGFFGYMLYSLGILIPCFVLVTFLFFGGH